MKTVVAVGKIKNGRFTDERIAGEIAIKFGREFDCIHCDLPVKEVDYFGTGHPVLADWSGAYECPGRTMTPAPDGVHERRA